MKIRLTQPSFTEAETTISMIRLKKVKILQSLILQKNALFTPFMCHHSSQMLYKLNMKTTSNGRQPFMEDNLKNER
jgi:hypothetical protein